jgi:hypothetical protein
MGLGFGTVSLVGALLLVERVPAAQGAEQRLGDSLDRMGSIGQHGPAPGVWHRGVARGAPLRVRSGLRTR